MYRLSYHECSRERQKRARELAMRWQTLKDEDALKEIYDAEEFTDQLYKRLYGKKESVEATSEHTPPAREKGLIENILADVKGQANAVSMNEPVDAGDIAKFAYKNKDKIKKEAIDKLEVLEDIVTVFNDAYHTSKFKAIDEVLAKDDYADDIKNNLLKIVGMDKMNDVSEDSSSKSSDGLKQNEPTSSSKVESIQKETKS